MKLGISPPVQDLYQLFLGFLVSFLLIYFIYYISIYISKVMLSLILSMVRTMNISMSDTAHRSTLEFLDKIGHSISLFSVNVQGYGAHTMSVNQNHDLCLFTVDCSELIFYLFSLFFHFVYVDILWGILEQDQC